MAYRGYGYGRRRTEYVSPAQQQRNRERYQDELALEQHRKYEAGQKAFAEARAVGHAFLNKWGQPWQLVGLNPAGRLEVWIDGEHRELQQHDLVPRVEDYSLEHASPAVQAAWEAFLGAERRAWEAQRHDAWARGLAEAEERRKREADRFRAAD